MQILPQPVEEEHQHALGNLADEDRADPGDGHKEALSEDVPIFDIAHRLHGDLPCYHQKRRQKDDGAPHRVRRIEAPQEQSGNQQDRANA